MIETKLVNTQVNLFFVGANLFAQCYHCTSLCEFIRTYIFL